MRIVLPLLLVLAACENVSPSLLVSADVRSGTSDDDTDTANGDTATADTPDDVREDLSSINPDAFDDATPSDVAGDASSGSDTPNVADVADTEDATDAVTPDTTPDAAPDTLPDVPECDLGTPCRPIDVGALPFSDTRDTRDGPADSWDSYGCAPDTDESGPEWVYQVEISEPGSLTASVEAKTDGADPDIHILRSLDPSACLDRGHLDAIASVEPGTYYLVVDTWVDGDGVEYGGEYTLNAQFRPQATGNCAVETSDLRMFWTSCAASVDCYDSGGERFLRMPATGPVVREAHLVTDDESFDAGWPTSYRDGLDAHYALSERVTGYVMDRREPWAPAGEGGSRWGQGSTGAPVPVLDEAWYVNMYWRTRPAAGTRIIVTNPANGRALVASGGYETGPGSNEAIGGAVEEIHHYLGTTHRSTLTFGFAVDQSLPLGPIECD